MRPKGNKLLDMLDSTLGGSVGERGDAFIFKSAALDLEIGDLTSLLDAEIKAGIALRHLAANAGSIREKMS